MYAYTHIKYMYHCTMQICIHVCRLCTYNHFNMCIVVLFPASGNGNTYIGIFALPLLQNVCRTGTDVYIPSFSNIYEAVNVFA